MRLIALFVALCSLAAHGAERHLLYMATPDAAQPGGSGAGFLVFDMDDHHRLVRRIEVPVFKEGIRGCCASAVNKKLYVTTNVHRLVCFDLLTDKVAWEKVYDTGCDRAAITPDGKTLYNPSGWWMHDNCYLVNSALTGEEIAPRIKLKSASHNTLVSLDGKRAYLGSHVTLSVVDTATHQIVQEITPIGEAGVFPFTVNGAATRAYVCLGKTVGFDIADLTTGKVLSRVTTDGKPIKRRTHGVGLTPDEKEVWVSDQGGNAMYVFDNTVFPPKQTHKIDINKGGHGWVAFSLDGKYAYSASTEVIDTKTKQPVATLKDENGKPFSSSKYVEVVFKDQDVIAVGDQFGVGRVRP